MYLDRNTRLALKQPSNVTVYRSDLEFPTGRERSATFRQFSAPLGDPPPRFLFRSMWQVRVESIDDTLGGPKRRLKDTVLTPLCNNAGHR